MYPKISNKHCDVHTVCIYFIFFIFVQCSGCIHIKINKSIVRHICFLPRVREGPTIAKLFIIQDAHEFIPIDVYNNK